MLYYSAEIDASHYAGTSGWNGSQRLMRMICRATGFCVCAYLPNVQEALFWHKGLKMLFAVCAPEYINSVSYTTKEEGKFYQ